MTTTRQPLGRGLGALLPPPQYAQTRDDYLLCALDRIQPDPNQPRQHFDPTSLDELVQSVREKGIIQPLVVRPNGDDFVLIAGERRLRAATEAGLATAPVVIKDVDDDEVLEMALVENLQREDLNAIEEALAYERLLARPGMTQQVIANRLGRNRSTIANAVRLLGLHQDLQQMVVDGRLSPGHGRALLTAREPDRAHLANQAIADGMSVRELEATAREGRGTPGRRAGHGQAQLALQPYCDTVAQELSTLLDRPVTAKLRTRGGRLEIPFEGVDDLRLLRDQLNDALNAVSS